MIKSILRTQILLALAGFLSIQIIGCNGDDKDNAEEGQQANPQGSVGNQVGTKYPIYVGALALGQPANKGTSLTQTDLGFRNRSIASGTPKEMELTIVSLRLLSSEQDTGVPIFLSDQGKTLKARSGYVDLTDLFTKIQCLDQNNQVIPLQSGQSCDCGLNSKKEPIQKVLKDPVTGEDYAELKCPSVQPTDTPGVAATAVDQLGTYTHLSMRIKAKGKIKGCVTGYFMYTVSSDADDKVHTYCTQSAKSLYSATKNQFTNADFESISSSKTAEMMEIPLDPTDANFASREFLDLTFPIAGGVVIDGIKSPQITLGIDLGRALRFSGLFTDHPREARGNTVSTGAHFFTLMPQTYQFVFVGKPGKIFGHKWFSNAGLQDTAASVPANRTCVETSNDSCKKLAGWMTTIFEGDGTPIAVSLMPDDDNAFTVLKGGNFSNKGFDKSVFTKKSTDIYDIAYGLTSPGTPGLSGVLYDTDFSKAVDATFETTFATKTMSNGKFSYGKITWTRML